MEYKSVEAGRMRGRTRSILIGSATLVMSIGGWLQWSYTPQVNASISALRASSELGRRSASESTPDLDLRDWWGRKFVVRERPSCRVLISYGSDGIPDSDYARACDPDFERETSCWWPTMDTVIVDDRPVKVCLK